MVRHAIRARQGLKVTLAIITFLFDSILLAFLGRRQPSPGPSPDKIMMLLRLDRIGDFILFLPAAQRIIDAWRTRGFKIILVINSDCMELAQCLKGVDKLWPVSRRDLKLNLGYRARLLTQISQAGVSEVLEPAFSRDVALGDAIVRFSGAHRRMGWVGDSLNIPRVLKRAADRLYTELFPAPSGPVNELRHNDALMDCLGIAVDSSPAPALPSRPPAAALPAAYYVLAPGASMGLRQWPAENFGLLASRIHQATGLTGLVCGDKGGRLLFPRIVNASSATLVDLTGHTALAELVHVISNAAFVVSNDSMAVHVAATVGVPSICMVGGGHSGRFHPYCPTRLHQYKPPLAIDHPMPCFGCNWICRYVSSTGSSAPCVTNISIDDVWNVTTKLLQNANTDAEYA